MAAKEKNQEFGARLRASIDAKGLKPAEFARKAGLKANTVSNYLTGVSQPSFSILLEIVKILEVSTDYLLGLASSPLQNAQLIAQVNAQVTLKDKMNHVQNPVHEPKVPMQATRTEYLLATPDTGGNRVVPIINYKAAATYLTGYQSQEYFEEQDAITVPPYMLRGGSQGLMIQVSNDSMEDTIYQGDFLLCRFVEPSKWLEINDFTVCVIVTESRGIQVKRVKNRLVKDKLLRLSSDNRRYPSFNVFPDDILQIWQVSHLFTANLPNRSDTLYRKMDTLEDATTDLREMYEQMKEQLDELASRHSASKKPV